MVLVGKGTHKFPTRVHNPAQCWSTPNDVPVHKFLLLFEDE